MITKIIGFLITKTKCTPDIDFFDVGLKCIELQYAGYYVYFWGMGYLAEYKVDGKYSL